MTNETMNNQDSSIGNPPSAISNPPSAIGNSPSAISHQPSAISHPPFTVEAALYVLIGAVALVLRLANLGEPPLLVSEAREALAVYRYTMSMGAPLSTLSPAWFALTSLFFTLFGSSEFWARFIPAIAGTAIVFVPLVFRKEMGRLAALAASALLAISAVAVASSRYADGTTLAALSLLLIVIGVKKFLDEDSKPFGSREASRSEAEWIRPEGFGRGLIIAGIGLGLGLADGARFFSALMAILFAFVFALVARPSLFTDVVNIVKRVREDATRFLIATGVTFLALSSAALMNRAGLSAAAEALPLWLNGWAATLESRPVVLIPQILFLYEPLILFIGVCVLYIAFVSGLWHRWIASVQMILTPPTDDQPEVVEGAFALSWRGWAQVMCMAAIGAMLFGILYPARESSDALWVVLILALIAGRALGELFGGEWYEDEWQTVASQAAVLFVMFIFAYFNTSGYARSTVYVANGQSLPYLTLLLAIGVIILAAIITVLFASGWSGRSSARGAMIAAGVVLLIGSFSSMWGVTQSRVNDPRELWTTLPTASNVKLMMKSVNDISNRTTGFKHDLEIVVLNDPAWNDRDTVLGWELREFPKTKFVDSLSPQINSPVVIADAVISDPTLGSTYVGQPFAMWGRKGQTPFALEEAIDWWLFRTGQVEYARRVLWVRQDVQLLKKEVK